MLIIILSGGFYILNHARSESPPTVFTRNSNCAYKPTVSASLISARWRDTSHGWPLTISRGTSTFSEFMFSSCQSIPVTTRLIACNWLSQPLSTFTPLIFSAIFYAANGENHVSYIDALFNCVSAVTVCGLATVDISSLTGFQQALLFFQSAIGSPVCFSKTQFQL